MKINDKQLKELRSCELYQICVSDLRYRRCECYIYLIVSI